MSPEQLVALFGAVLAFAFGYFPWLKDWFEGLSSVWKPLVNAGLLLVLALALVGLSCGGFVDYFACGVEGVLAALILWVKALLINQLTYTVFIRQYKQRGALQ